MSQLCVFANVSLIRQFLSKKCISCSNLSLLQGFSTNPPPHVISINPLDRRLTRLATSTVLPKSSYNRDKIKMLRSDSRTLTNSSHSIQWRAKPPIKFKIQTTPTAGLPTSSSVPTLTASYYAPGIAYYRPLMAVPPPVLWRLYALWSPSMRIVAWFKLLLNDGIQLWELTSLVVSVPRHIWVHFFL